MTYMKYLSFILDSTLQVHGRDGEQHSRNAEFGQQPSEPLSTEKQPRRTREFSLGISFAYKRNPHFIGREDVLGSIFNVLQEVAPNSHPKSVALTGSVGVGKTQIALEYAYRHQETYASIFWVDGSSESAASSSITSILKQIQVHYELHLLDFDNPRYEFIAKAVRESSPSLERRKDCEMTPIEAFLLWLSLRRNPSWLLIIDNVDDLEGWDYRSVLPSTHRGATIVTSRRSDLALYLDTIQVNEMDDTTAMALFSLTSGLDLNEESLEIPSAQELVRRLGYLPLAIVQAGSCIFQNRIPVEYYLLLFSSYPRRILSGAEPISPWEEKTHPVLATWDISFQAINERDPVAARILMVGAYLSPHDISLLIFSEGMEMLSSVQLRDSVQLLQSYSLIGASAIDSSDAAIGLHPSVQLWAKYCLDSHKQSDLLREALVMVHKVHSLYGPDFEEWIRWNFRLGPHVARLAYLYRDEVSQCSALPEDLISAESWVFEQGTLTTLFSLVMRARGKITEAQNHLSHQISRIRQIETLPPSWQLLHHLRHTFGGEDRLNFLAWVVCEAQRLHSLSHPVVLDTLGDYANALQNNRYPRHGVAYMCFKWLLEARTNILGLHHPGTSGAMLGLGRASTDCSEKVRLLTAAASLRMRNLGHEDPQTRTAINALSRALCGCRQYLAVADYPGGYTASSLMLEWLFPEYHGRPPWESSPGTFDESLYRVFQISAENTLDVFADCDGLLLADLTRQLATNAGPDTGWALMRPFFEFTTTSWCCDPDTFTDIRLTAWQVGADVAISWVIKNVDRISRSPTLLRQVVATIEESYMNGLDVPFWTEGGSACLLSQYSFILWLLYVAEGDKVAANLWLDTAIAPHWERRGTGSDFADPWAFGGICGNHDEFDGRFSECEKPRWGTNMPPQAHYSVTLKKPPRFVFADLLGRLFNSLPDRSSRHDSFVQEVDDPVKCDNCVGYALIDPVITTKSLLETHAAGWLFLSANSWYGCQRTESQEAILLILRSLDLENSSGLRRDIWESLRHFHHDGEDASTSCFSDIRLWQMCRAS